MDLLDTLNMVVRCVEKFLGGFEAKVLPQKQVQTRVRNFWENLFFEAKLLLQSLPETILRILRPCSRYLEGPPNFVLCVGKKIRDIPRTKQIICKEKRQKPDFLKNRVSKSGCGALRNLCQNPVFWDKTFASKPPRNFSTHLTTMFRVSRRPT